MCGAEMRIEGVATDDTASISGLRRQTFKCSMCGDIEQRLAFVTELERSYADADSLSSSPLVLPSSAAESAGDVPRIFAKRFFVTLLRIYRAMSRFTHRRTRVRVLDLAAPHALQPGHEPIPEPSTPPPSSSSAEPAPAPTPLPTLRPGKKDSDADDCEKLLRRAIEVARDSTYPSQAATRPAEAKSEPRTKTTSLSEREPETPSLAPDPLEAQPPPPSGSLQPQPTGGSRIVVQIEYDHANTKYVVKDINTGLRLLRHYEIAWLRAMCERMGWQVVGSGAISEVLWPPST
jgi:hypothetical protein